MADMSASSGSRTAVPFREQAPDSALDFNRDERGEKEILRVLLSKRDQVADPRFSGSIGEREDVPKHLGDQPRGAKFGNEMRSVTDHAEGVGSSWPDGDLFARFDDVRVAESVPNPKHAVADQEALLLPEVTVERPAVPARTHTNFRSEDVAA
jgi:hypothetical protein